MKPIVFATSLLLALQITTPIRAAGQISPNSLPDTTTQAQLSRPPAKPVRKMFPDYKTYLSRRYKLQYTYGDNLALYLYGFNNEEAGILQSAVVYLHNFYKDGDVNKINSCAKEMGANGPNYVSNLNKIQRILGDRAGAIHLHKINSSVCLGSNSYLAEDGNGSRQTVIAGINVSEFTRSYDKSVNLTHLAGGIDLTLYNRGTRPEGENAELVAKCTARGGKPSGGSRAYNGTYRFKQFH